MELKLSAFMCAFWASLAVSSHSAPATNGKLLKFYPITRQHYRDILALTKTQPVVSEADIVESHRSLADWSSALQSNWNVLVNNYGEIYKNVTSFLTPQEESYPVCVMKTPGPLRRKRSGEEQNNSDGYAALAPNELLPSSYYKTPQRRGRQFDGVGDEDIDVENNADNEEEGDGRYVEVQDNGNEGFQVAPHYIDYNGQDQDYNAPNINCIVVVKRRPASSPNAYPPYPPYPLPQYPYPPPLGYPQQMPPPIPYPPYPYPPHPYPYNYYPSHNQESTRGNERLALDPAAVAQYQKIVAKYYRQLSALYNADAATHLKRSEPFQTDRTKETTKKRRMPGREKS